MTGPAMETTLDEPRSGLCAGRKTSARWPGPLRPPRIVGTEAQRWEWDGRRVDGAATAPVGVRQGAASSPRSNRGALSLSSSW